MKNSCVWFVLLFCYSSLCFGLPFFLFYFDFMFWFALLYIAFCSLLCCFFLFCFMFSFRFYVPVYFHKYTRWISLSSGTAIVCNAQTCPSSMCLHKTTHSMEKLLNEKSLCVISPENNLIDMDYFYNVVMNFLKLDIFGGTNFQRRDKNLKLLSKYLLIAFLWWVLNDIWLFFLFFWWNKPLILVSFFGLFFEPIHLSNVYIYYTLGSFISFNCEGRLFRQNNFTHIHFGSININTAH